MSHLTPSMRKGLLGVVLALALGGFFTMLYVGFTSFARNSNSDVGTAPASVSGGSTSRLASSPMQENVGGDVTIQVTWQGPDAGMAFGVVMDTHSVDMDAYDLSTMVVLHTNDGRETAPVRWDAPKGLHHREGNLVFSDKALDGSAFLSPGTRSVELVIYELAGVPTRSFTWDLK
ncbi:MAG: hypothetical protein ABIO92_00245 [Chloroflexia bacterium]